MTTSTMAKKKQPRLSKEEWKAQQEEKKAELSAKFDVYISNTLSDPEKMKELGNHYKIVGQYTYSFGNTMLIKMQGGSIAYGYSRWKKMGRTVKQGEHSRMVVWRPIITNDKKDKETGEVIQKGKLIGFKLMKVFDVGQTEGKELEYLHNSEEIWDLNFHDLKTIYEEEIGGLTIKHEVTGQSRGWSDGKGTIAVSSMSNNVDKVKTLFHELAHHILHKDGDDKHKALSRGEREVEAEATAALVSCYFGYEPELSAEYIAHWKQRGGTDNVRKKDVLKTAEFLIKAIDTRLKQRVTTNGGEA